MTYVCELYTQEAQPMLSIRTHSPVEKLPQLIGDSYEAIAQYLGSLGEAPAGIPFVGYFNMDMANLDIEMGFPVSHPLPGEGNIQPSEMPKGQYASCIHTGPYEQMAPAYEALTAFVQERGLQPTGVSYEFYFNSPGEVAMEELKTQIVFPILQQ